MRRFYYVFSVLFVALALYSGDIGAQRYVDVPPGRGTLNEEIAKDTLPDGSRNDPENTIYRLQRGPEAYYLLEGSVSNSGFPLTIVAEEGDGARPFLQPAVVGDESSRAFRARGDLKLVSLHVTNLDELGGLNDRIIRCSAEDINIVAEDCWFDKSSQSLIRTDDPGQSYFLTNCVISNIGEPLSPNNGRGIDDRGNDIDTVWIENCTWYNLTSRVIRDDGGKINFAYVNHNTIVNVGQMGITFGPIDTMVVTNNLMMNAGFMPRDDDDLEWIVLSADSVGDKAPGVMMAYNSAYLDSTKLVPYLNDTTTYTPFMNPTLTLAVMMSGMAGTNHNLNVEFNNGPPFNDSILIYHYNPDYDPANAPFWEEPDIPGVGEGGNGIYHLDVPYDFGYVNRRARVGAMDGQLGDTRWTAENEEMGLVDFEVPTDRVFWHIFGNDTDDPADLAIVPNPDPSGINTSAFVMMFNVQAAAQSWAGAWSDVNGTMTFTEDMHHMEMMVWKNKVSNCGLKVEQGGTTTELKVPNTVTGEWELVTFDFSANIGETLTRLVFFPDFDARTEGTTAYVDNIRIVSEPVGVVDKDAGGLRVYPNPATETLIVQQKAMTAVMVRDILGKTVRSVELNGEDHITLEVSDLVEGVYFITVESGGSSVTAKFLKR